MKNRVLETLERVEFHEENNGAIASRILDLVAEGNSKGSSISGVVVGKLVAFDNTSRPLVNFVVDGIRHDAVARTTIALGENQLGSDFLMIFEQGDPRKPIVMGSFWQSESISTEVVLDGERVVLTGKEEIVLRCGKASITLTRAGKVLIQGEYVLSRSLGMNRIKGGSVQIN
jgi:hypothetical protein